MTVINGEISNQLGAKLDGTVWLAAAYHRPVDNVLVLADWADTPLEDSAFSAEAIPGPARLRVEAGSVFAEWDIVVPDEGPVEVTSLMQDSIDYPEPVILAAQAAATRATQEANRAEAGAARVGSAEVVLDARDQATAAATTANGAAATATEQADRATTEADRAEAAAGTAAADAAAAAASDAAGLVRADLEAAVAVSASAAAGSAAESEASAVRAEAAAVSAEKPIQMVTSWPTDPSERVLYMMRSGAQINARIGSQFVWSIADTVVPATPSDVTSHLTLRGLSQSTITKLPFRVDTTDLTNFTSIFRYFSKMEYAPPLDTRNATSTDAMFYGCMALKSVPPLDTRRVTSMSDMFRDCTSLTDVPSLDTRSVTDARNLFRGCTALRESPKLDLSNLSEQTVGMFRDCTALKTVTIIGAAGVTDMSDVFSGCTSLTDVTIDGAGPAFTGVGDRIDLTGTIITPTAADRLMGGLGTTTKGKLRLPATAQGCDTTIATTKGWTVTVA